MERTTSLTDAKILMGSNFIGPDELALIADKMGIDVPSAIPVIPFSLDELKNKQEDYILLLCAYQMKNERPLNLKSLRDHFGIDPEVSEPCFYNQDWYLNEDFYTKSFESSWLLIRKNVVDESRGKNPDEIKNQYPFYSAIICAYSFFVYYFHAKEYLWKHDFVWCNDFDNNGDRIYVARYIDPLGLCKNGFSIHRHLKIRKNYGTI